MAADIMRNGSGRGATTCAYAKDHANGIVAATDAVMSGV